ncbi:MAG: tetratricopeptide repeat protein [Woeseiaceae bacterium]|nr:tetratricopeptide repeat protein [Woeseiaceae bacterium]
MTADAGPAEAGLFADLRKRKVFRVMAAYAVSAWLILQIVDVLAGAFPVPDWTLAFTTMALAIGFPIAAALSWAFKVTPQGVELDVTGSTPMPVDRSRLIHFIDVVIIGILLVIVAFLTFSDLFPTTTEDQEIRLAVLPFDNLTNDEDVVYLSEGLADDIRARLHNIPQLRIAGRSISTSLSGMGFDATAIGERLDVRHILEGSIRVVGDRIRVAVQLIDVESGLSRWDRIYDTRFDDVLEMQNNISLVVANQLEVFLSREVRDVLAENPTDDPVAYDFYLQAKDYLRRPRSMDNVETAAELFQRAIDVDPGFALGYAGLCRSAIVGYALTNDTSYIDEAERTCGRALTLDSRLSEVHAVLGRFYLELGRTDEAKIAFSRALAIDPRSIDAFLGTGQIFEADGNLVEAEARFKAAANALPGNWQGYNQLALFMLRQGRFDEAIEYYEKVIELSPDNAHVYNDLGSVYFMLGDFAKAAEHWRASLEIEPGRAAYSNVGTTYYYAGDFDEAAEMFRLAIREAENDHRLWGNLADALRFIPGKSKEAAETYRRAIGLAREKLDVRAEDPATLTELAWYYANLGDEAAAQNALNEAQALPNRDLQQRYFDALIYAKLDQPAAATAVLRELVSVGFPNAVLAATPEFADIAL